MTPRKKPRILKADLHIHTARSGDSDISALDVIAHARTEGLDIVGVTDHNTTKGATETWKLAKKESPELTVLIGQEVRSNAGEIIVFGVDKDLPKKIPLEEVCKQAKEMGGFIVVPHPFDRLREGICNRMIDILPYIDAVEVLNAKSIWKRFNKKAREFAEEHGLPMVAGSDAHIPQYIGSAYTLIEWNKTGKPKEKDIYAAIKARKTSVSGNVVGLRGAGFMARIRKLTKKLRRV